jgi:hypothetical protein
MIVHGFDLSWLTTSIQSMVSPLQPQFYQSVVTGTAAVIVANLANIGVLAMAVVGAVRSLPGSAVRALSIAVGMAMLVLGPVLTVIYYLSLSIHFGIPSRYGLSLVPAMAVVAGTAIRTRLGGTALMVIGALFYAVIAWRLLAA